MANEEVKKFIQKQPDHLWLGELKVTANPAIDNNLLDFVDITFFMDPPNWSNGTGGTKVIEVSKNVTATVSCGFHANKDLKESVRPELKKGTDQAGQGQLASNKLEISIQSMADNPIKITAEKGQGYIGGGKSETLSLTYYPIDASAVLIAKG